MKTRVTLIFLLPYLLNEERHMAEFEIIRDFPYPVAAVWRAMTEPDLVARWTVTGRSGRPVGFAPVVGNRFRLVGKPVPGWRGVVDCEVLEVEKPRLLRYTWQGDEGGKISIVTFRTEPLPDGTRLTFEHTGFSGIEGFFMSRLLKSVRKKMLDVGLPPVLESLAADPRLGSASDNAG
jgi:uncharacterized protein YndB with AHSA1/START domain